MSNLCLSTTPAEEVCSEMVDISNITLLEETDLHFPSSYQYNHKPLIHQLTLYNLQHVFAFALGSFAYKLNSYEW